MWYYIKDKKKFGPFSEASISRLYKSGEIGRKTNVWDGKSKRWVMFCETHYYKLISEDTVSTTLDILRKKTRLLRGIFTTVFIVSLISIYFNFEKLFQYTQISQGIFSPLDIEILARETGMTNILFIIIFALLMAIIIKLIYDWIFTATISLRSLSKGYAASPMHSALSILAPIINLVYPCVWLKNAYSTAFETLKSRWKPFDVLFFFLWWFFTVFTIIVFIIDVFVLPSKMTDYTFKLVMYFSIYVKILICLAIIFWEIIISRFLYLISKIHTGNGIWR